MLKPQETKPQQTNDDNDPGKTRQYVGKWTIRFGKYKSKTYSELVVEDPSYLKWLWNKGVMNNDDVNEYIAHELNL